MLSHVRQHRQKSSSSGSNIDGSHADGHDGCIVGSLSSGFHLNQ